MESKTITITASKIIEGGIEKEANSLVGSPNLSSYEVLGLLRFWEKKVWLDILNSDNKPTPETKPRQTITEFINQHEDELNGRIINILKQEHGYIYIDEITKDNFLRLANSGRGSWYKLNQVIKLNK
jgi:hypothetical protein